jgi:hypothetical protein
MADNPEVKVESAKASPEQETRPKPKKRQGQSPRRDAGLKLHTLRDA